MVNLSQRLKEINNQYMNRRGKGYAFNNHIKHITYTIELSQSDNITAEELFKRIEEGLKITGSSSREIQIFEGVPVFITEYTNLGEICITPIENLYITNKSVPLDYRGIKYTRFDVLYRWTDEPKMFIDELDNCMKKVLVRSLRVDTIDKREIDRQEEHLERMRSLGAETSKRRKKRSKRG